MDPDYEDRELNTGRISLAGCRPAMWRPAEAGSKLLISLRNELGAGSKHAQDRLNPGCRRDGKARLPGRAGEACDIVSSN
jgi:hypothetical protein